MKATVKKYFLKFKQASGTSRGVMTEKETWFLILEDGNKKGIGECCVFRGLSYDDSLDYSDKLNEVCLAINNGESEEELWNKLREWPSIQFGIEQAFLSLKNENPFVLFPNRFTNSQAAIPINGLVWMGNSEFMKKQIDDKLSQGFNCIKLKIGAINFNEELKLLAYIRSEYPKEIIEIRVDANGGFNESDCLYKLNQLAEFHIHSIEQPIAVKKYDSMSDLCKISPLPIALDEELIGVINLSDKENLLDKIKPQYIILKPSLVGGFKGSLEWIELAKKRNIGWWITSALESNIGLNAISQWTYTLENKLPQGLGTGALFTNNFESPLIVKNGHLWYSEDLSWDLSLLD